MALLEQVEAHLRDRVAPQANTLDHSLADLQQAFRDLGQQDWLGLKIPGAWGGLECSAREFQAFQELLAQYSGALAFLQAQHQSAGGLLSRSANLDLQREYLPGMATGAIAVGIAFSHLRRPVPVLKALPVAGGYVLQGSLPWITGYGLFQAFVGAAVLPDGPALYAMLPFTQTVQADGGKISFSEPLPLAAMNSTNTVTAELQHWFLPESQVVFIRSAAAIQSSDRQNVLQHSFYALGCARAALNLIQQMAEPRSQAAFHPAYALLDQELRQCRTEIYEASERSFTARVALRAWAIELAGRCAHVAVTLSGGGANLLHHPAQRIYRETLVFTVTGQTAAIREATVERLIRRSPLMPATEDNSLEKEGEKT